MDKVLTTALTRIMRPLVRVLLRHGMSYGAFADLCKWVYVDVASEDFTVPGRKQSVSRVSVITGINRKEVARLQAQASPEDESLTQQYNRAARVISGWLRDEDFLREGEPAALPLEGEQASFSMLVKKYSGDVPVRAVLDELLRVNAVQRNEQDYIELVTHAYVPAQGNEEKLHILGTDVALLVQTIEHNINQGKKDPYFQRKVAYNNLPEAALPAFKKMSGDKAQKLLEELDAYLARCDRDSNPAENGTGIKRAGMAIYYFEEDVIKETENEDA